MTSRSELPPGRRQALALLFGLSLGGYLVLTALATIDPGFVWPFLHPGWFLLAAIASGGVVAARQTQNDSSGWSTGWLGLGLALALAAATLSGLVRDGFSVRSAIALGLAFGVAWWVTRVELSHE